MLSYCAFLSRKRVLRRFMRMIKWSSITARKNRYDVHDTWPAYSAEHVNFLWVCSLKAVPLPPKGISKPPTRIIKAVNFFAFRPLSLKHLVCTHGKSIRHDDSPPNFSSLVKWCNERSGEDGNMASSKSCCSRCSISCFPFNAICTAIRGSWGFAWHLPGG